MKVRTFFGLILLCIALNSTGCKSTSPAGTPATVEEAEAQIAKKRAKEAKASKREMKKAKKAYWKRQSPAARKSVKQNEKRQRKMRRAQKRAGKYNYEDQERW